MDRSVFADITRLGNKEINLWYPLVSRVMRQYGIHKKRQKVIFLSFILAESNIFSITVDNMAYSALDLKKRFTNYLTPYQCEMLSNAGAAINKGQAIANLAFHSRLGNKARRDGWKYRRRGVLPVIGLTQYARLSHVLGYNFIDNPEWLEEPAHAIESAGYLWHYYGLREMDSIEMIKKALPGGTLGTDKHYYYYENLRGLMGIPASLAGVL